MIIKRNISLGTYNTFGIDATAREFVTVHTTEELEYLLRKGLLTRKKFLVIGGGSNILFTCDFDGLVIRNRIMGIEVEDLGDEVVIRAGAGELWHDLVSFCIEKGFGGVENLSLIPGSVGAAPIQNIGAYGVELKDHFESLEAMEIESGELHVFRGEECRFGYRDSIFKHALKHKYVIISVSLRLQKNLKPDTSYGAITDELAAMGIVGDPDIRSVGLAVESIRRKKLPDPEILGNAGSFFKNPVIRMSHFETLEKQYPGMPSYDAGPGMRKVPAGWLIEQCGWKGRKQGMAGVHDKQALVLVNHGGATGEEILSLANNIRKDVMKTFGISLEMEVNVV